MNNTAVITLERLWGWETSPNNKASVKPFLEGIQSLRGDFDFHYSHIYGRESIREALTEFLRPEYRRVILQIAGHGSGRKISSALFSTVFETISDVSNQNGFNGSLGLIMSSCLMGGNKEEISRGIRKAKLQWFFGYNCATSWMESTLIDTQIIYSLSRKGIHSIPTQESLVRYFNEALSLFNGNFVIDDGEKEAKCLKESVTLMFADGDFRRRPIDVSDQLFDDYSETDAELPKE
jgi:hypothetical protein